MTSIDGADAAPRPGAPRTAARIAGLLWIAVIFAGVFAEVFVRGRLIVGGDAPATAARILQSQTLFRLGFFADLTSTACYLALMLLLYPVLAPAGRAVNRVAMGFGLVGAAVGAVNLLTLFAPIAILAGRYPLEGFTPLQLQTLAAFFLRLHGYGFDISLVFFSGVYLTLIGYLVVRSTFLPRWLGGLLALAGVSYLVGSLAPFASQPFASKLSSFIFLPGLVAEGAAGIWLSVVGLDAPRWRERAARP